MILVSSVGTMAAGVAEAVSSNIELVSGNGSVGGTDPKTLMSLDGGSTFQPASIINPHPSYSTIPGTSWVSDANGGSSRPSSTTIFQTTFDLPAGVQTPSITVQVHADNAAAVLLNGTQIGAQREDEIFENFQDPAETYTATGPFVAGTNVLRFVVRNFSGPMALDYRARVSYSTPASTDLGVVLNGVPDTWAVGSAPFPASATVTNAGPDALGAGEASVTVGFPSGLSLAGAVPGGCSAVSGGVSCPVPALAVGATWTSPAVELSASRPTGSRTVTASVATVPVTQDQDDTDNTDSDDVAVVISTDLSPTLSGVPSTSKATVPFMVSSAVRNSGPSDLAAGEAASTITIGPGLELSGLTPAGCTATATTVTCPVPALVSNGSWTMPSVTVVGTSAGTSSTVTATTTTVAAGQDPVPANDSDADAVTIAPPPAPVATLSTTTLDFGPERVGSSGAPQSVDVTNTGDAPLHMDGVTVTGDFAVDSGCSTGTTLAPAQSCTVRVTFTPTTTDSRPGTMIIAHDAVSSPDIVSLSGVGQLHADVSLSLDAGPGPVRTGRMTYRITVRNSGPDEATGLVMSDTLPVDAELVSIDPGSWSCTTSPVGQSGTVRCGLASLASGATATLEVVVKVVARGTAPVSNTASVSTTSHDPHTADNAATVVSSVGRD